MGNKFNVYVFCHLAASEQAALEERGAVDVAVVAVRAPQVQEQGRNPGFEY